MLVYNKYLVREGDAFNADNFPKMIEELNTLKEAVAHLPANHRADIIISYLKGHSIRTDYSDANPKLVEVITSNTYATGHIEALFEACKPHKAFSSDFQNYLNKVLLQSSVTY